VRFVAVGDVMIDIVCSETPSRGSRVHAGVSMRAGGSAVNSANYAAAACAEACVVGRIGNDPAGDLVRTTLAANGIEAQLAQDPDLPTGAVVLLRGDESVSVIADRGANARLSLAVESQRAVISGDTLVDFGRGLEINERWLRPGVTREEIAEGLRPLLELPVEHVLATHRGPTDRAALARALA
jgi:sugar/nucleoside kinase (ribokinase family)